MSTRLAEYDGAPEHIGEIVYEPGWYLLGVSSEAQDALFELLEPLGVPVEPAARPHISVMKGEAATRNKAGWGGRASTSGWSPSPATTASTW